MTQLPLNDLMRELAQYLGTPLNLDGDVYRLMVPLDLGRQQEVNASIRADEDGRPIIAFITAVGTRRPSVDPWRLLATNATPLYCRIALVEDMIVVLASQLLATAQAEEVLLILRELAQFADQLERQLFVGDQF